MSTPQPPRSSYRERRINVMLQDNGPIAGPAPESQTQPPPPLPVRQERKPNRSVLIISIAVTLLCAGIVFFLLFRHDATQSAPVARAVSPAVTPQVTTSQAVTPAPEPTSSTDAAEPTDAAPALNTKAPEPERVRFQLKRSGSFQTFGPLKLRLISATPRKGVCQLAIIAGGDHSRSRSVSMNRTIQVQGENGVSVGLVVNGMTKDGVKGMVVAHEMPSEQ